MKCPQCGGPLRVFRTLQVRDDAMVRDHRCKECRRTTASVIFLVDDQRACYDLRKRVLAGEVCMKEEKNVPQAPPLPTEG